MKKLLFVMIFTIFVIGFATDLNSVKAFNWNYYDGIWDIRVYAPDIIKPGKTENFTVYVMLHQKRNDTLHLKLYLNTTTQLNWVIFEGDVLPYLEHPLGYYVTWIRNITIPSNAVNNGYIYARLETLDKYFNSMIVSIVQEPPYTTLETQITTLTQLISNYTAQINSLNIQINTLQITKLTLQEQVANLTTQVSSLISEKTSLQNQVNTLQQNVTSLEAQILTLKTQRDSLQSQVNSLTSEKAILTTQVNTLTTEKANLTAQVASLTNESGMYKNYAYGLGALAIIAILVAIYFMRKPQTL